MLKFKRNIVTKVMVLLIALLSFNGVAFATVGMTESEPNDLTTTATVIPTNYDLTQEISATIGSAGDVDYYKFIPLNSGGYSIETLGTTDTFGYLYDNNMNVLDACDDQKFPSGINCELRCKLVANNTYYIKINHKETTGTGDYNLKITPVIYDNKEVEPNGSFVTANSVEFTECASPTAAEIGVPGDEDYYKFSISSGGNYTFETVGNSDVQGYLYDSNFNQLAFDDDSGDVSNMKIDYNLSGQSTYYVKVCFWSALGSGCSYGLKVTPEDNASTVTDLVGNDFSSATVLTDSNAVSFVGQGINNASDVDFFAFTPSMDGVYTFESNGGFDVKGEVYNSNQTLIKSDDNSGENNNFKMNISLLANQTYYLKVAASNSGATGTYNFDIYKGKCLSIPEYLQQPNDSLCWATSASMAISYFNNDNIDRTLDIAKDVAMNKYANTATQTLYGNDYYKYPHVFNDEAYLEDCDNYLKTYITSDDVYVISNEDSTPGGGENYTISELKKSIDNGYPMLVKVQNPAGGGHMMILKGYKEDANGNFDIIYNDPLIGERTNYNGYTLAYTTFYPWYADLEPNNTRNDSSSIISNTSILGSIEKSGDVDYYKFGANPNLQYVIETTGDTDTYGVLYDSNGNVIETMDNGGEGNNFKITRQLSPYQSYYIEVRHSGTGTGDYTISVSYTNPI